MRKIMFFFLLVLASCANSPAFDLYVSADRKTYEAISSEYIVLVKSAKDASGDVMFDADGIARRERLVESWKIRIEEAEKPLEPEGK